MRHALGLGASALVRSRHLPPWTGFSGSQVPIPPQPGSLLLPSAGPFPLSDCFRIRAWQCLCRPWAGLHGTLGRGTLRAGGPSNHPIEIPNMHAGCNPLGCLSTVGGGNGTWVRDHPRVWPVQAEPLGILGSAPGGQEGKPRKLTGTHHDGSRKGQQKKGKALYSPLL